MIDNILEFRAVAKSSDFIDQTDEEDWAPRRRANRRAYAFRSLKLILESDEIDLVRDIRFDIGNAKTKLKKIRQRLKSVQEQAATQVAQLTAAENRLSGAIETTKAAPAMNDKSGAYRDLLAAFGRLDRTGQEAIVKYLKTQV
jgi:hypothetical protein